MSWFFFFFYLMYKFFLACLKKQSFAVLELFLMRNFRVLELFAYKVKQLCCFSWSERYSGRGKYQIKYGVIPCQMLLKIYIWHKIFLFHDCCFSFQQVTETQGQHFNLTNFSNGEKHASNHSFRFSYVTVLEAENTRVWCKNIYKEILWIIIIPNKVIGIVNYELVFIS